MNATQARWILPSQALILGFGLVCGLAHAETILPVRTTTPVQNEMPTKISTGMLVQSSSDSSVDNAHIESHLVSPGSAMTILSPMDLTEQSFASQFSGVVLSQKMSDDFERKYQKQFDSFEMRQKYFATSENTRSPSPYHDDEGTEIRTRFAMSHEVQHYMIWKGIPEFLGTREATKNVAKVYTGAVSKMTSAGNFQVKTKNDWKGSTGMNIVAHKAWVNYSNKQWIFEASGQYTNMFHPTLFMRRSFYVSRFDLGYDLIGKCLTPGYFYNWTPRLQTSVGSSIPMASQFVMRDTTYSSALAYSF